MRESKQEFLEVVAVLNMVEKLPRVSNPLKISFCFLGKSKDGAEGGDGGVCNPADYIAVILIVFIKQRLRFFYLFFFSKGNLQISFELTAAGVKCRVTAVQSPRTKYSCL